VTRVNYSVLNADGKELIGARNVSLSFALKRIAKWLPLTWHCEATITVVER